GGVITLDKDWFGEVRAEAGVSADKMTDNRALLINYREANEKGRMVEYKPYRFRGQSVTLVNAEGAETELKLAGEITAPPASLLAAAQSAGLYEDMVLVVSPEAFNRLAKGNEISAAWFALTANAEALAEVWRDIDGLEVINISEAMSVTRNINALIMLFIYGFIGMLSLIGVTSVIGAISTNISLRVQEFALLAAVGMTPRGRRRMLNLESLFYGVKALCIGVPVGLAVSYLMYMLLSAKFGFAYTVPWFSILVSIAAVFAIVFATMRYAGAKVGSASIVESMRNMNI
ncbi:MAG: ABC transporter permease, partial [Clostridiales bacterium]|nr:ABC transporter permease [Clostridiales bacterium]